MTINEEKLSDMDNITNCILAVINDLKLFNAADKLGSLDEIIWRNTGERIWSELSNNLSALIDYLKSEYQQGRKIDPQIECLRDSLHVVETAIHDAVKDKNKRVILEFQALRSKCAEWKEWIDRYYPQVQATQESVKEESSIKREEFPNELNTERAKKYFPRAEKAGYIEGQKWNGDIVRLGYFCSKVYSNPRPINALENYFGVKKLSASISQAETEPKRSDAKQWRKDIDDSIFYD